MFGLEVQLVHLHLKRAWRGCWLLAAGQFADRLGIGPAHAMCSFPRPRPGDKFRLPYSWLFLHVKICFMRFDYDYKTLIKNHF